MRDPGSFRDPSGYVFRRDGRIFRALSDEAYRNFLLMRSSGAYGALRGRGWLISAEEVELDDAAHRGLRIVEHPKLPFVSYPYEWPISLLKRAALLHLDLHICALDFGFTLSDASAYNIQFCGIEPVFIDTPSLVPYRDGDLWTGQRQFVEQFLNPLLLGALCGVFPNAWYRGAIEGIPTADTARLIGPLRRWLSPQILANITLPDLLQRKARRDPASGATTKPRPLPKDALLFMLKRLRRWISRLQRRNVGPTEWQNYASTNESYQSDEERRKQAFIAEFSKTAAAGCAWDLGCNTGLYSEILLRNGTRTVVGFDFDLHALEAAVDRATSKKLQLLPLFSDLANPSPAQGWAEAERQGISSRIAADAVIALALVHHLAIGRNIPLPSVLRWLIGLAPRGVIEFVPKSDPMIKRMMRFRKDIFPGYGKEQFEAALRSGADTVRVLELSPGGRTLYEYKRSS
jgi:ribosomal protein L11 methylase PrmA